MVNFAAKHLNILVADDETATTATVSYVLEHSGHSVEVVHDGADALCKLQESPALYDLLITDHAMKFVSGLDLVGHLRQTGFKGRILVLSAYLNCELREAYRALGIDSFVDKPFDITEFREAVSALGAAHDQKKAPDQPRRSGAL